VTQEQYEKLFPKGNPSEFVGGLLGDTSQFPVERVSWDNATAFTDKLNERHRGKLLPSLQKEGYHFRLPTEAQWEYACRAGTTTPFHFGPVLDGTQANCNGVNPYGTDIEGPFLKRTERVGSYPANAWGLFDMHGNVWQLCEDRYDAGFYKRNLKELIDDPKNSTKSSDSSHVMRGGCWRAIADSCRAASRDKPGANSRGVGFRVCFGPD
jgi:formylglycine-generating enzyme required for sulfatase activity